MTLVWTEARDYYQALINQSFKCHTHKEEQLAKQVDSKRPDNNIGCSDDLIQNISYLYCVMPDPDPDRLWIKGKSFNP